MATIRSKITFIFLLGLGGCSTVFRQSEPIARVNGQIITVRDFRNLYDILKPKELTQATKESGQIKSLVLKTLVRRSVILTAAKKKQVAVSEAELEVAIEKYKQGYTADIFRENLLEQMVDEKEWREQIRQNLLISKIFDATEIPKPALKQEDALLFYEKNSSLYHQAARATALHLVVADKAKAEELRKIVVSKPKEFLALARKNSLGPEAQDDAKINIEKGLLPNDLDRALFDSSIGSLSQVIESPYGYHLLRVLERSPEINKDFEQARADINKRLEAEQRMTYLSRFEEELLRSAQIEYNRDLIKNL